MCSADAAYKLRYGVDPQTEKVDANGNPLTDKNGVPYPQFTTPLSSGLGAQFLRPTMMGPLLTKKLGFDQLKAPAMMKGPLKGLGGAGKK